MLTLFTKSVTDKDFLRIFNRLCVALRETQDDSGVTQSVYFDALKDLPPPALEAGAVVLMKEQGRRFFPTTAEWRTASERNLGDLLREAVQPRDEPWHDECGACGDTGWERRGCDGGELGPCGRRRKHAPHEFAFVCTCRPTNRTFQRHQWFGSGA